MKRDPGFWLELCGRLGPPVFAGTMVACLLSSKFQTTHGILMGIGFALIVISHFKTYHGK